MLLFSNFCFYHFNFFLFADVSNFRNRTMFKRRWLYNIRFYKERAKYTKNILNFSKTDLILGVIDQWWSANNRGDDLLIIMKIETLHSRNGNWVIDGYADLKGNAEGKCSLKQSCSYYVWPIVTNKIKVLKYYRLKYYYFTLNRYKKPLTNWLSLIETLHEKNLSENIYRQWKESKLISLRVL